MTGTGEMTYALMCSARPVRCKTELGAARARTRRKVIHRIGWVEAAYTEGRIQYFAGWACGDKSWDVVLIASPAPGSRMCRRCESLAQGPFVYRCFDADGRLLYIGSARCRVGRFQNHSQTSPWWPEVVRTELTDQPDIETARAAEVLAIKAERPLRNKQHNGLRVALPKTTGRCVTSGPAAGDNR